MHVKEQFFNENSLKLQPVNSRQSQLSWLCAACRSILRIKSPPVRYVFLCTWTSTWEVTGTGADDTVYLQVQITPEAFSALCEPGGISAPSYTKCLCMDGGFFGPNWWDLFASFIAQPQNQLCWLGAAAGRYCPSHRLCTAAVKEDNCTQLSMNPITLPSLMRLTSPLIQLEHLLRSNN